MPRKRTFINDTFGAVRGLNVPKGRRNRTGTYRGAPAGRLRGRSRPSMHGPFTAVFTARRTRAKRH